MTSLFVVLWTSFSWTCVSGEGSDVLTVTDLPHRLTQKHQSVGNWTNFTYSLQGVQYKQHYSFIWWTVCFTDESLFMLVLSCILLTTHRLTTAMNTLGKQCNPMFSFSQVWHCYSSVILLLLKRQRSTFQANLWYYVQVTRQHMIWQITVNFSHLSCSDLTLSSAVSFI